MPRIPVDQETKNKIIRLYKEGVINSDIEMIVGLSKSTIAKIVHKAIEEGLIEPKISSLFNKPVTPKGQGKGKYIKKGYHPHNKKLTEDQERELLEDYFEKDMTYKQIMEKYSIWQGSIKIIIDKALNKGLYQAKGRGNHRRGNIEKGDL